MLHKLRLTIVLGLVALLFAGLSACGGDDDDNGEDTSPAAERSGDDEDNANDDSGNDDGTEDNDDSGGFDFGAGTAVVTIGDRTFEFDLTSGSAVCRDVFDAIQVSGKSTDDENVTLSMWIPPSNWDTFDDNRYDPPSVEVEDDTNNNQWIADPNSPYEIDGGNSQVDSFEKDGLRASGTATFTDAYALLRGESLEPVQGTFEVSCEE